MTLPGQKHLLEESTLRGNSESETILRNNSICQPFVFIVGLGNIYSLLRVIPKHRVAPGNIGLSKTLIGRSVLPKCIPKIFPESTYRKKEDDNEENAGGGYEENCLYFHDSNLAGWRCSRRHVCTFFCSGL